MMKPHCTVGETIQKSHKNGTFSRAWCEVNINYSVFSKASYYDSHSQFHVLLWFFTGTVEYIFIGKYIIYQNPWVYVIL
jgi:hypothetical protein